MAKRRYHQHHRRPRSRGGDNSPRNISLVDHERHVAWHRLFSNHTPEVIATIITTEWLDPDWELVAKRRKEND